LKNHVVINGVGTYHFFTEVLYDYGTAVPQEYRYRAMRSDIIEVKMEAPGALRRADP
jgi:hypothetical protein